MDYIAVEPVQAAWSDQRPPGTWTCMVFGAYVIYRECVQELIYDPSHQSRYTFREMYWVKYSSTAHDDPSPPKNYKDFLTTPVIHGGTDTHSRVR